MHEYWGAQAIGERLGVSKETVYRWWHKRGLLMYKRPMCRTTPASLGRNHHWSRIWYTNDDLIRIWEIAQVHAQRKAYRSAGRNHKQTPQDQPTTMQSTTSPPDVVYTPDDTS